MTATAHALIGGAIVASVPDNPALGLTLCAISHPILDLIPHWDFGWGWRRKSKVKLFAESMADFSAGFILAYLLFHNRVDFLYLMSAVAFSYLPDLLEVPYWFFKWKFPPFSFIYKIQSKMQGKAALPWGVVTQVVSVGVILFALKAI